MRNILNPNCAQKVEKDVLTTDLVLCTTNVLPQKLQSSETPKLSLFLGPEKVDYLDFVKEGWKSEKGEMRNVCIRLLYMDYKFIIKFAV